MIAVVDTQMGNLGSVANMLDRCGLECVVTADHALLRSADQLILPGVGAFDAGMRSLAEAGVMDVLAEQVLERGVPLLGVCLGMQLLARRSEEGTQPGLGWLDADVRRIPADASVPVPHMGWNEVTIRSPSRLFPDGEHRRYYFVHSYHVVCDRDGDVLATSHHGVDFAASVGRGNIFGVQFHPEKSHRFGMELLTRFASIERTTAA